MMQVLVGHGARRLAAPLFFALAAASCVSHRWVGQSGPVAPVLSAAQGGDVLRLGTPGGSVDLQVDRVDSSYVRGRVLRGKGLVGVELVDVRSMNEIGPGPLGRGLDRRSVDLAGVRRDPAVLEGRSFELRTSSGMVILRDVQRPSDGWITGQTEGRGTGLVRVDRRTATDAAVRRVDVGRTVARNLLWVGALAGVVVYCDRIADNACGFGWSLGPSSVR
jgi:hypothetical protein